MAVVELVLLSLRAFVFFSSTAMPFSDPLPLVRVMPSRGSPRLRPSSSTHALHHLCIFIFSSAVNQGLILIVPMYENYTYNFSPLQCDLNKLKLNVHLPLFQGVKSISSEDIMNLKFTVQYLTRDVATFFTKTLLWHFCCGINSEPFSRSYDVENSLWPVEKITLW